MSRGRPRKPRNLKVLEGTLRPDRDYDEPDYPLTDGAEPPHWLNAGPAWDEWQRLVPILEANGVLTEADLSALAHLCNVHGKIVKIWLADDTPPSTLLQRLDAMQGKFGLNPSERSKVPTSKAGKKSKYDDIGKTG